MIKKLLILSLTTLLGIAAFAQGYDYSFTEAADLTIVGKVFPDTPKPYQRMDFT